VERPTREQLVRSIPAWRGSNLQIEPLSGGITNRNFMVTAETGRFVVRLPGERTELLAIDRQSEAEVAYRAADLGIGPPVIGELAGVGTLITKLVDGVHLDGDEFGSRLEQVVGLLRLLHGSPPVTAQFPIHRIVERHAADAAGHGVDPPTAYERLVPVARRIEAAFAAVPVPPVLCHNDLLPGNVLFDGDRAWLLDFEYSGMNAAEFDLANLSVNCGLSATADASLLTAYWGEVSPRNWARLQLMKVISELREGMWAVVQQAISNLDTDFVAYAEQRLSNAEQLAASPDFAHWLDSAIDSSG
jgi:thiamine kinase-like enzyme